MTQVVTRFSVFDYMINYLCEQALTLTVVPVFFKSMLQENELRMARKCFQGLVEENV